MNPWRATLWGVNFLLVGAIAYAAAVMVALLIERNLGAAPVGQMGRAAIFQPSAKQVKHPLSAYQPVLDRNIFNAKRSPPKRRRLAAQARGPAAKPSAAAPPAVLADITLTGTFVAGDGSFAMAIVGKGGGENLYRLGECLPLIGEKPSTRCKSEQAKLTRVERDRIVLVRNGKSVEVKLTTERRPAPAVARNRRAARSDSAVRARSARARLRASRRDAAAKRRDNAPAAVSGAGELFPAQQVGDNYEITVPKAEVEKAFENFAEIAGQAAAVPIIENGEPKGFQLRKIKAGSIFQRLGLRNNDLIQGVNGESLTTADQALRLFTVFRNEREIVLDIIRNDQPIQLAYTIE